MDNMRYKIFNRQSGEPLAYANDITAAVRLLTYFNADMDRYGKEPEAALIDKESDRIL